MRTIQNGPRRKGVTQDTNLPFPEADLHQRTSPQTKDCGGGTFYNDGGIHRNIHSETHSNIFHQHEEKNFLIANWINFHLIEGTVIIV